MAHTTNEAAVRPRTTITRAALADLTGIPYATLGAAISTYGFSTEPDDRTELHIDAELLRWLRHYRPTPKYAGGFKPEATRDFVAFHMTYTVRCTEDDLRWMRRPPTRAEVRAYFIEERGSTAVLADAFFDEYTARKWCSKNGRPLDGWHVSANRYIRAHAPEGGDGVAAPTVAPSGTADTPVRAPKPPEDLVAFTLELAERLECTEAKLRAHGFRADGHMEAIDGLEEAVAELRGRMAAREKAVEAFAEEVRGKLREILDGTERTLACVRVTAREREAVTAPKAPAPAPRPWWRFWR